nr:MAG TPA: hypothetical protein [Caudoviricetes sp.]
MGLFSSANNQSSQIDEDKLYSKALLALEKHGDEFFNQLDNTELSAIIIHHDLQEIKKEIQKLNDR